MTAIVVDASAVVAMLTDPGATGAWAVEQVQGHALAAPHLVVFEAANVLRRMEIAGQLSSDHANLAYRDLCALPVALWPYEAATARVWDLRHHVTAYDASYVALAELLETSLVTLDGRLAATHGLRCPVLVPST